MAAEQTPLRKVLLMDIAVDFCSCRWVIWAEHYPDHWDLHVGPACDDCWRAIMATIKRLFPEIAHIITN